MVIFNSYVKLPEGNMHDLRPQHGKNITRSYDWKPWTPRLDLREVYEAGPEIPKVLPVHAWI
jgi:hypothetical protein